MATLTSGNVHVNVPLTNLARLYRPLEDGFIAEEIAPRLNVNHETDSYYVWQQADFFGTEVSDLTADRTEPREVDFLATTETYAAKRRELAWTISTRERANADNQLRLEQVKQSGVLGRLQILREMRLALILKASDTSGTVAGETFTGGLDPSMDANAAVKWDNTAATYQNVLTDVVAGITLMRRAIGVRPNVIIIPASVVEGLHKTTFFSAAAGPQIVYSGSPTTEPIFQQYPLLPSTLWGMRVLVPGAIKNTAKEGQTASYSDIWFETVTLAYVTPGPSMETPSVAYTFTAEPRQTRQARDEIRRLDWYAVGETIDEKVVAPFAAYNINDCLT
jgi:hypothetical protein